MPYEIREEGGRYCVCKKGGETKKCYDDRSEAEDYMKALYAAEDDEDEDDKGTHESSLGDGDPDTVILDGPSDVEPDDVTPEPIPEPDPDDTQPVVKERKPIFRRIWEALFPDQNTAFKVVGNHFLITWSNNFEDRDGELFTEKAIDAYVRRVDIGMVPPPELWVWHSGKSVRIGEAEWVARHEHFVVAAGQFDDTPTALKAKAYYTRHQKDTGVSHGFTYAPDTKVDGVYHSFNTFEISLLPKAVAANPFTNLEQVKESMTMALSEQKRKYLRDVFGDEADRVLETLEESGKALEEMQMAYKDFADPNAVASEPDAEAVTPDLKAFIPDLLEQQAEVFRTEAGILNAIKEAREQIAALVARVEAAEQAAEKARKDVEAVVNDLPRRPSTDAETVVEDKDLSDAMKNSMKQLDETMTKIFGVPYYKTTP